MTRLCVVPLRACQDLLGQRVQKESLVHRFPFSIIFQSHYCHTTASYTCRLILAICCVQIFSTSHDLPGLKESKRVNLHTGKKRFLSVKSKSSLITNYWLGQQGAVLTYYSKIYCMELRFSN